MFDAEDIDWGEYYRRLRGREPRNMLLNALNTINLDPTQSRLLAIDLGCGNGTETVSLLKHGWHVLAVDAQESAIQHLMEQVPITHLPRLQTLVTKFEDITLPPTDLIFASYSIPFCTPEHFNALWKKIVKSIKQGGWFAGNFFGVRDTWATTNTSMTFHTEQQVRAMLKPFDIKHFLERDEDGQAMSGPKHWHQFHIIARKN